MTMSSPLASTGHQVEGASPSSQLSHETRNTIHLAMCFLSLVSCAMSETRVMDYVVANDPETISRMWQALYGNPEVVSWVVLADEQP